MVVLDMKRNGGERIVWEHGGKDHRSERIPKRARVTNQRLISVSKVGGG